MRAGIKYCGGCNPHYDRAAAVERLKKMLPEVEFAYAVPGGHYDALLLVNGCSTQCASAEGLLASPGRTLRIGGFDALLPARDRLRAFGEEEGETLSHEEVLSLLPHRAPLLLVDRAVQLLPGREIRAELYLDPSFPVFQGHFPGSPVLPGSYAIEAMAQAAALMMLRKDSYAGRVPLLSRVERAIFRQKMLPGDSLTLYAACIEDREEMDIALCRCEILREGRKMAEAELCLSMKNA